MDDDDVKCLFFLKKGDQFHIPNHKELQPIHLEIANKPKLISFALLVHMRRQFYSTMVASISDKYGGGIFPITSLSIF